MSGPNPSFQTLAETRQIATIALPLIAALLLQTGMGVIDTLMAARISTLALAAVALGSSVWFMAMLIGIGLMMALTPTLSQLASGDNNSKMREELRQGVWLSLGLGLFLIVLLWGGSSLLPVLGIEAEIIPPSRDYMLWVGWCLPFACLYMVPRSFNEAMGFTMPMFWTQLALLPLNALGNYIFMFGKFGFPAMGAAGAGLATGLAQTLGVVILASYTILAPRYRQFDLARRMTPPDWPHIKRILALGIPIAMGLGLESGMFTATTLLMGRFGADVTASHQIALNVASISFMLPLGISMALTVRVGRALGSEDYLAARQRGWLGIKLCAGFSLIAALILGFGGTWIASLYTDNIKIIALAANLMILAAIFQLVDATQIASMGVLRGYKDTRIPMFIAGVSYWIIGLGIGLWLGINTPLGPAGLWTGLIAGLAVASIAFALRFNHLSQRTIRQAS